VKELKSVYLVTERSIYVSTPDTLHQSSPHVPKMKSMRMGSHTFVVAI